MRRELGRSEVESFPFHKTLFFLSNPIGAAPPFAEATGPLSAEPARGFLSTPVGGVVPRNVSDLGTATPTRPLPLVYGACSLVVEPAALVALRVLNCMSACCSFCSFCSNWANFLRACCPSITCHVLASALVLKPGVLEREPGLNWVTVFFNSSLTRSSSALFSAASVEDAIEPLWTGVAKPAAGVDILDAARLWEGNARELAKVLRQRSRWQILVLYCMGASAAVGLDDHTLIASTLVQHLLGEEMQSTRLLMVKISCLRANPTISIPQKIRSKLRNQQLITHTPQRPAKRGMLKLEMRQEVLNTLQIGRAHV